MTHCRSRTRSGVIVEKGCKQGRGSKKEGLTMCERGAHSRETGPIFEHGAVSAHFNAILKRLPPLFLERVERFRIRRDLGRKPNVNYVKHLRAYTGAC